MDGLRLEPFKVKDVFDIPNLQGAALLGGAAGLEREVTRVNVMEVPDVIDWVRPGELLMTTGYPFKDQPEVLAELVAQLARKGVAALGIKTKRFVDEVPASAVEAAERHGMPLIELPPATTFSDVVREVMERVLVSESKDLTILQGRVQRLSQVLLHGDGLPAFLRHLEAMVRHPAVLAEGSSQPALLSPGADRLGGPFEPRLWLELAAGRPPSEAAAWSGTVPRVHAVPIEGAGGGRAWLLVLEQDGELGVVDSLTISWAARLLGFELANRRARESIESKYLDQFLQDWIAGRILSESDLRLRAEACGWKLLEPDAYRVGIAVPRETGPAAAAGGEAQLTELARELNRSAGGGSGALRWTVLEGALAVLDAFEGGLPSPQQEEASASEALRRLEAAAPGRFALCFGRPASSRSEVARSYREAGRTAQVRRACGLESAAVSYGELGVYLLLFRLQGSEELEEFCRLYLEPLLALDGRQQGALLKTLRVYFACNCNAKETADRMFVHYNTIVYRLDKLKAELGLRLDDPETKLLLQMALKAGDLREGGV
ncbi:PucR family transcriptional regulator [Paenibacillus pasadenensis]|uniref:Regulator of polyketide synthase expression n=1 Tax=Paenibacillus pasadenensis TaxID=217090 RepID=A0A2N5NAZ6_9BACL|nr:PucR family transcriptional regulator [Paenibacillus pasadenensis]PLT47440.1 Regulator of polyketide synthase expression [Paenibacillus pasadenensis]